MNDDMAAARTAHPERLRWFASLPWQYPDRALPELERAATAGASGVMVLANIDGQPLTDPVYAPIWSAIDARALPVLVHPTAPPGVGAMDMSRFQLTASIGFTFDTIARDRANDLRRLFRSLPPLEDHRVAWRWRAAVPDLADGSVLRKYTRLPGKDFRPSVRISAADLRRRRRVLAGRVGSVRKDLRRR